jgi:hypothetical protein
VAVLLAAGLVGCDGSDGSEEGPPGGGGAGLGVPVRLADCEDWRRASVRQRTTTVRELRAVAGGPVGEPRGRGATLPDDDAYELLDNYCKQDAARSFKLYKLYARAASFRAR